MADKPELESLYREAQSVLKAREYDRAVGLLTQILVIDENYKDVSRLLAQSVKLKRRRWYSHPATWGTLGFLLLIGLGILIFPKISSFYAAQPAAQIITATTTPSPIPSATPTATLLPTPTPIPLAWKRIALGLEFPRDAVIAFATDKKDPDVIYAAMMNAGVYKTIDGGLSWRPTHLGLASTQMESLLIDSQNLQILYAVTMDGIYKTEDDGENWFRVGDGTDLLMDVQNNSHLYARDENGIYETTDQGSTWTSVYTLKKDCPDAISSWAIHPTDGRMLFIGGGETCAGVYQSNDSGHSWTLIGMEDKPNLKPLFIGLDEQGSFSVYVGFDSEQKGMQNLASETGIYVSHDGGANWTDTSVTNSSCDILTSDPDNPSTIYCAGFRLSFMRGKGSWQQIPGTQSRDYTAMYIDHPKGKERIIASGAYVSKQRDKDVDILISTDGGTSWEERNVGIGSAHSELKIDPMDNTRIYLAVYYIGACTLYSSLDSGKNWSPLIAGDWCGLTFDAANAFYLIQEGALQMSSNGGENWLWGDKFEWGASVEEWDNFVLPNYYHGGSQSISANPYLQGLVYDIGNTIYYSTGSGWQRSGDSEGLSDAKLFYTDQGTMIYAIGRYHQSYSTDNGVTWQNCGGDVSASRSDTRLAIDLQSSHLYLATPGQGVLISTDNCGSWQASNDGLGNLFVNTLAVDPNNPETIYAGTDGGAYVSYDGGAIWGQVNDGLLGATVVYSIAIDKNSNIYAATPYGIFQLASK